MQKISEQIENKDKQEGKKMRGGKGREKSGRKRGEGGELLGGDALY
jgi:hypothetical protein